MRLAPRLRVARRKRRFTVVFSEVLLTTAKVGGEGDSPLLSNDQSDD
jgi:hypothetical protein